MISKEFFKSSFFYSFVGALPYASGIILIPFFTKYLTHEDYGANEIYLIIMYIIQILASFGLDTYIGINYFEHKTNTKRLNEFIGTVFISLIVLGTLMLAVGAAGGNLLFHFIFEKKDNMLFFPYGFITIFTAVFNGFFKTYTSLLINQQRPVRFLWMNVLNFSLTIIFSIGFLKFFPKTLFGPILGRLIPAIIACGLSISLVTFEFGFAFKKGFIDNMISFCLPIVVYLVFAWIVSYIDRFIIKYFLDLTYVGIYALAVKIAMLIDIIQIGLANTIHPKVYTIWKDNNLRESTIEVNRYYNGFTAITLLIIPVFMIAVPLLGPIFIKDHFFYKSFTFISFLCLGFATRGWYYMALAPIFFFKKTKVLPNALFFTALFQILVSLVLIKYFSLWGAVAANLIVKPFQAFILYLFSRKIFKFKINIWKMVYLPVLFIIIILASELFFPNIDRVIIGSLQFVITGLLVVLVYRHELKSFFPKKLIR
jgi:O-antigen/teichoic acid export membrane protein